MSGFSRTSLPAQLGVPDAATLVCRVIHRADGEQRSCQHNHQKPARHRLLSKQHETGKCEGTHTLDPGESEVGRLFVLINDGGRHAFEMFDLVFRRVAGEVHRNRNKRNRHDEGETYHDELATVPHGRDDQQREPEDAADDAEMIQHEMNRCRSHHYLPIAATPAMAAT